MLDTLRIKFRRWSNATNILRKCWQKTPQVSTSATSINFLGMGWNIHLSRWLILLVMDLLCWTAHLELLANFPNSLSNCCRALALEVLNTCNNNCYFFCQTHEKSAKKKLWQQYWQTFFFNNKRNKRFQRTAEITKQNVESFKQSQRSKKL